MEPDILFNTLTTAIQRELLFEKYSLSWFTTKGQKVNKTKKITSLTLYASKLIPLEEKAYILINAPVQDFFLAHNILVGDKAQIQKAKTILEDEVIYFEKKNYEKIQHLIEKTSVENISPQDIKNLTIKWDFKKTPIIEEINKYLQDIKNFSLNKLYIIPGENIELFIPTAKKRHLLIAQKIQIPVVPLIEEGFIKDLNFHIHDSISLSKELKPTSSKYIKETIKQAYNNQSIYRELDTKLFVKIPTKEIIDKIENKKIFNQSKEELEKHIKKINKIEIGTKSKNKNQLPLWKTVNGYESFLNTKTFEEFTGLNYDRKKNELDKIYLIDSQGEEMEFQYFYLNKDLESINPHPNTPPYLNYSNYRELCLKLLSDKISDKYSTLVKKQRHHLKHIDEIFSIVHKLSTHLIEQAISQNKLPEATPPKTPLQKLISHYIDNLIGIRKSFIKESQETVLENTNTIAQKISRIKKISTHEDNYFILESLRELLTTLRFFNEKKSSSYENFLEEIFSQVRTSTHTSLDEKNFNIAYTTFLALELNKKNKKLAIYSNEQDSIPEQIKTVANIYDKKQSTHTVTKLNKKKIKELFPKSNNKIISEYEKTRQIPSYYKRKNLSIPIDKTNLIIEIPIFHNFSPKHVTPQIILYSKE